MGLATSDWMALGLAFSTVIAVPLIVWGGTSIISLDKRFTAHELVDDARFTAIKESLARIELRAEAHDVKLDQAIERLPARRA